MIRNPILLCYFVRHHHTYNKHQKVNELQMMIKKKKQGEIFNKDIFGGRLKPQVFNDFFQNNKSILRTVAMQTKPMCNIVVDAKYLNSHFH